MKKNLDITKLRYSEHILPVRWPFVKSRFHCILRKKGGCKSLGERGRGKVREAGEEKSRGRMDGKREKSGGNYATMLNSSQSKTT